MPWFKVDDAFYRHPKVRRLGKDRLPAIGLWQLAGTWCADNLDTTPTDGFIPLEQVETWDPKRRYAQRLVDVGFWKEAEHHGEHGFVFHDWPDYQPTKAERDAEREAWRTKKAGQRKGSKPPMSPGDTNGDALGESTPDALGESPEIPGTRSRTRSRSTSVGGVSREPARASAPPPRCPKHLNDADPPPCRACRDARQAAEAWTVDQSAAELKRRRDCVWCNADGDRLVRGSRAMPVTPYVRCDHTRDQLDRPEAS